MTQSASMPMTKANAYTTNMRGLILLLLVWLGWPLAAQAQTYTISPSPFLLAQTNTGVIINNACIWTYTAGTTTAATTYSDISGTPNTNPIRSDSAGRFTAFLLPGSSYKFVYETACTPPAHGTTLKTADNIAAVPAGSVNIDVSGAAGEAINAGSVAYLSDGSGGNVAGSWYNTNTANTYSSSLATMVGVAPTAVANGATGSFRIIGRVTGLTGLTAGAPHYITNSNGALTPTAPANARYVGTADSTTSIDVNPNPRPLPFAPPFAIGDLLYADTTATLAKLSDVATGRVLASAGTNTAPAYSTSPTLTSVTVTGAPSIDASASGAGQIKFPATQNASANANTLDDYQETTWTPADGSGASLVLTVNSAQLVKIGQFVSGHFDVTYPATANGSNAIISGLTFTNQAAAGWGGVCLSPVNSMAVRITSSSTTLNLITGNGSAVVNSTLSGSVVRCTFSYRAAN